MFHGNKNDLAFLQCDFCMRNLYYTMSYMHKNVVENIQTNIYIFLYNNTYFEVFN